MLIIYDNNLIVQNKNITWLRSEQLKLILPNVRRFILFYDLSWPTYLSDCWSTMWEWTSLWVHLLNLNLMKK